MDSTGRVKFCHRCSTVKPADAFSVDKFRNDGLRFICKACEAEKYALKKWGQPKRPVEVLPDGMKRCSACREVKPLTAYHRHRGALQGVTPQCIACKQAERHARIALRIANLSEVSEKTCNACAETKPASCFYRHSDSPDGRQARCIVCQQSYSAHFREIRHLEEKPQLSEKRCARCRQVLPGAHFKPDAAIKDGLSPYCLLCLRLMEREAKRRWRETHRAASQEMARRCRDEKHAWLAAYKADRGCIICGERDPDMLTLHHRDPGDKVDSLSALAAKAASWGRIRAEVAKCDVYCQNHHFKLHAASHMWRQRLGLPEPTSGHQ